MRARVVTLLRRAFALDEPHPRTAESTKLHNAHIKSLQHGRLQVERLGNSRATAELIRLENAARRR